MDRLDLARMVMVIGPLTSLLDFGMSCGLHCWIIFLFSDLITEQALILLHADEMEEAPNKRNALASLTDNVVG